MNGSHTHGTLLLLLLTGILAGCGAQVGRTAKAYDICTSSGYFADGDVNSFFVLAEGAYEAGESKVETIQAVTYGCSTWYDPSPCLNCMYAIVDAAYPAR